MSPHDFGCFMVPSFGSLDRCESVFMEHWMQEYPVYPSVAWQGRSEERATTPSGGMTPRRFTMKGILVAVIQMNSTSCHRDQQNGIGPLVITKSPGHQGRYRQSSASESPLIPGEVVGLLFGSGCVWHGNDDDVHAVAGRDLEGLADGALARLRCRYRTGDGQMTGSGLLAHPRSRHDHR
ncbi:hypothetical protein A9A89_2140 [Bifidobacterium psychraerophilum DSM 22366]|uniref:Uncharacterized protein n=1 Tax=Bifidobacterium psychraerophilum TaxID=218140 RepID=A0A087CE16_9BIFI|nr:hypothetical protein BPSY_1924 [Bifidobacterium psychraerophilum]PKA95860.1 hypothetical protein A9A89_2140 [Bifidobacterium psychraerophilum DSM 22366]